MTDSNIGAPEPAATQSNDLNLLSLKKELGQAQDTFKQTQDKQGIIGIFADDLRNEFGGSAQNGSILSRYWSNVLDSDTGSRSIQNKLTEAKTVLDQADNSEDVKQILSTDGGNQHLKVTTDVTEFDKTERRSVDFISDGAAVIAGLASKKLPFISGAIAKVGLKFMDGTYSKPADDALMGAGLGLAAPAARLFGKIALIPLKVETQPEALSNLYAVTPKFASFLEKAAPRITTSAGLAAEGSVFSVAQTSTGGFEEARANGASTREALNNAWLHADPTPGLIGGAVFGGIFPRLYTGGLNAEVAPGPKLASAFDIDGYKPGLPFRPIQAKIRTFETANQNNRVLPSSPD